LLSQRYIIIISILKFPIITENIPAFIKRHVIV
jgi:hypothetical protein